MLTPQSFGTAIVLIGFLSLLLAQSVLPNKDFDYGPVVIIMSRGRSGSDYISRVTENIAGARERALAGGILGQSEEDMHHTKHPQQIIESYLRAERAKVHGYKNIIGFKWKPFYWNKEFDLALAWCAAQNFRVLWSHRNPLDEWISRTKHSYEAHDTVAHCRDAECAEQTRSLRIELKLNSTLEFIALRIQQVEELRQKLETYHVKFLEVHYENFVFGPDESRLKVLERIVGFAIPQQYQRRPRLSDFTTDTLMTTDPHQNHTVQNYAEVAAAMRKHGYQRFLYP